ncbi:MAG: 50S ribosomal protein L6 [Candidatus Dasytiphilus stammeri]
MSRIAKNPIKIPNEVEVKIQDQLICIKGHYGKLSRIINNAVEIIKINDYLRFQPRLGCVNGWTQAGTARAIINSMIIGVTKGFSKTLQLVGIGFRAFINDNQILTLALGFSHLIHYKLPPGITAECPSATEIILKGSDKQLVGQVAADIYAYRRPEPYKGRGIRYSNQVVRLKEAKKK